MSGTSGRGRNVFAGYKGRIQGGAKMFVKKEMSEISKRLGAVQKTIEEILVDYDTEYADYGWDNFSETLANISAQIYLLRIQCGCAIVRKELR